MGNPRCGRSMTAWRLSVPRWRDFVSEALRGLGATLTERRLPYWPEMITANSVTLAAEALAYHRPDADRWQDYFAATRLTLARGALVTGADYVQAQRVRSVARDALAELFQQVDVVVCPTAATGAPGSAALLGGDSMMVADMFATIFTPYWDAVGNPVLAVPMGFTAAGLPLSFQVAGRPFGEATVLRVGCAYQQATDWHLRRPPMAACEGPHNRKAE